MKIVITSTGNTLGSPIDPRFGRCQFFLLVDPETTEFKAVENQAMMTPGGAGIQAAQFVVDSDAEAVITGNVGPNAAATLTAAGIRVLTGAKGTVRETLTTFRNGQLRDLSEATVGAHYGMAGGMGTGMGRGMDAGGRRQ